MSATKDMFMDSVERLVEDFSDGKVEREDALKSLIRFGFYKGEAETMLDEAVA